MNLPQEHRPRWTRRPGGSTWGDFGADDRLGRLNLIDDACRRAAAREVVEGRAFCLSLPLDEGPDLDATRLPPRLAAVPLRGRPKFNLCACECPPARRT